MKHTFKIMIGLCFIAALFGCSKKDENYKKLVGDGEIYYPGAISNPNYFAGYLRTQLIWSPSPDPQITKYKIFWNNKQDSMEVAAASHNPLDTVKAIIPNLREGTYTFNIYSVDRDNHVSIAKNINSVRVYGPVYLSGIFNRGYNADTPYTLDILRGSVRLKFNRPDSINIKTVVTYQDNSGNTNNVTLKPDSNGITLNNFKFGTNVTYQSAYIPTKGAIDVFTVPDESTYPAIVRSGDITSLFIKNSGNPFLRSDNNGGKWGNPKDWQYTPNVVNQDGGKGGGWSWDYNGVIHVEAENYSGPGVNNGKVFQTISLPAGTYSYEVTSQNYGGNINANEVVAKGTSLPDIDNLSGNSNVLAMYHGDQNSIGGVHAMTFTLTERTTVTIGWVLTLQSYTYMQFRQVALKILQ